jgi:hypothetical protein
MFRTIHAASRAAQNACVSIGTDKVPFSLQSENIAFRIARLLQRLKSVAALLAVVLLACGSAAEAGVFMPPGTPLKNFGFAPGGRANTRAEYEQYLNITRTMFGAGGSLRTGLGWDSTNQNVPGFEQWSYEVLQPAIDRGLIVIPSVRTINLGTGELRIPSDAQWAHGVREVVRMYGPNGVYQKGGSYVINGRTIRVAPHLGFKGLTDFEIWNEPESKGDASGTMTPAKMANLLKIAANVMRDQAKKQGFAINIMGPGTSGFDLAYLKLLKSADPAVFSYLNTLSVHAYTRNGVNQCKAGDLRCVKTLDIIRTYLNTNGGLHLHLAVTEAGVAGDKGTCLGPQVRTEEQQRQYSEDNFNWMRARPYLKMDLWITTFPFDRPAKYSYACDSNLFDPGYWVSKLGVLRPDGTMKPWGTRWKQLVTLWRAN